MADVFLSYDRADRKLASWIVASLEAKGFSVWWDQSLGPVEFNPVIETELESARCVLAIWSSNSLDSRWVRDEADSGLERGVLMTVKFGGVRPPLGFRQFNAVDLTDWQPGVDHSGWRSVLRRIERTVRRPERQSSTEGALFEARYRLGSLLGEGGMGQVYRADDVRLRRPVAIKIIKPALASDRTFVDRFYQEARIASQLTHPCSVTALDFGQTNDGTVFLVMEYLEGSTLYERLKRGPIDAGACVRWFRSIVAAIADAHSNRILHRDVKPENIFLQLVGGIDVPRLLDFGIAKALDDTRLTATGTMLGTMRYMAPEAIEGSDIDERCDLYSIGVVLYECLAGKAPFEGTRKQIATQHLTRMPPPLPEAVDETLRGLVIELLAKDPQDRPQSATEVVDRLHAMDLSKGATHGPVPVSAPAVAPPTRITRRKGVDSGFIESSHDDDESAESTTSSSSRYVQEIAAVARLICVSGAYAGLTFALDKDLITIGRVEDNDIVIENRTISRVHAHIERRSDANVIVDRESANGIVVNGEEYHSTDLRSGDLIQLGSVSFRYVAAFDSFVPNEIEEAHLRASAARSEDPELDELIEFPHDTYRIAGKVGESWYYELHLALREGELCFLRRLMPELELDPEIRRMFLDEWGTARHLTGPGFARLERIGILDGSLFVEANLLRGASLSKLSDLVAARGVEPARWTRVAARIASSILASLRSAHWARNAFTGDALHIVHRGISAAGIFVTYGGEATLIDFSGAFAPSLRTASRPGSLTGSLAYLAPEHFLRRPANAASDIFSLGVLLYEMTLGANPFVRESDALTAEAICTEDPVHPRDINRDYPEELAAIVTKSLEKRPRDRFPSAEEMRSTLLHFAMRDGQLANSDVGTLVTEVMGDQIIAEDAALAAFEYEALAELLAKSWAL